MDITLNYNDEKPLYEQVVSQIRRKILLGQLSSGESLPTIRALSESLALSRGTIVKIYQTLKNEGVIYSTPDGYYVSDKKVCEGLVEQVKDKISSFSEVLQNNGFTREDIIAIVNEVYEGKI